MDRCHGWIIINVILMLDDFKEKRETS